MNVNRSQLFQLRLFWNILTEIIQKIVSESGNLMGCHPHIFQLLLPKLFLNDPGKSCSAADMWWYGQKSSKILPTENNERFHAVWDAIAQIRSIGSSSGHLQRRVKYFRQSMEKLKI